MLKHKLKIFSAIILITASTLQAQNYNDAIRLGFPGLGSNGRALGMGNAFNALSDDASASYFNPAGFGLIKKMEISGGLSFTNFDNTTTFFGRQSNDNATNTSLNRISFALPFPTYQGSLVFGMSYHQSKDLTSIIKFDGFNSGSNSKIQSLLDTNIPYDLFLTDENFNTIINGNLNQSGNNLSSGGINNWTFSGAIEVQKNFFVGANFNFLSGSFESNNDYYEDDTKSIYQGVTAVGEPQTTDFKTFYLNNTIKWDIGGWDAKLGFLYQFEDVARFGATVQFPKTFSIDEEFLVSGSSEFASTTYTLGSDYNDKVAYEIVTPFELSGAGAINLKGIILSAEATFIDYSQLKFQNSEDGLSASYIADVNKEIKDILRSVINYNLGFEYTVASIGLRIRGGYITQQSAFDGDDAEFNHKYLTGGLGFLADGNIGIDVAYAYGWWKDIGDNYDSNVSRTFQDVKVHNVMLTTTLRF
jgi:Outer membrane protein transport protein (OMPP1/FadL/TodX)